MSLSATYLALFPSAFGTATLLPLKSEAVLVGMLIGGMRPVGTLLTVATVGNVLGSVVNWVLGRYVERWRDRRWFPARPQRLAKAQADYHRYGRWSLLLSWMPIIGDPLTVVAGVMREPLWSFVLIGTIAKAGRYVALATVSLQVLS